MPTLSIQGAPCPACGARPLYLVGCLIFVREGSIPIREDGEFAVEPQHITHTQEATAHCKACGYTGSVDGSPLDAHEADFGLDDDPDDGF